MRIINRCFLVGSIAIAVAAKAAVLVDTGDLDPSAPAPLSNFSHADGNQWQAADRFVITNEVLVRRVDFWGIYWNAATNGPSGPVRDDFTIRIFADTNGAPNVQPIAQYHVGRVNRRRSVTYVDSFFGPYDFYAYSTTFHPAISLPPGQYWLSVVNDIPVEERGVTWSVGAITPSQGDLQVRNNDGEMWNATENGYGIAFKLRGVKRAAH